MSTHSDSRPELAHDVLRHSRGNPLDASFIPKTVALVGATERPGSVGFALLKNLSAFGGVVYPINPKHSEMLGLRTFPNISAAPGKVDLAVIVTPAPTVPGIIRECVQAGVPGAIIISAGFKECGAAGAALELQCLAEARRGKMRLLGPNCLGLMVPHAGLNATFAEGIAQPGSVAFLSQSGALCSAVLDWSFRENVGFSAFVSVGSMLDIGWGDLITHFGDDPHTKSLVCYMESVGDARGFLSAAREVALTKPIIVLKVGRTDAAARAAASHTGALTGSDAVLDAAFRRAGVLRVNTIGELFSMAELLAKQPRPSGPRLTVVTNAGGPGALATDALVAGGGQLAVLQPETLDGLNRLLPPHWSHGNPIDVLGDADAPRYARAVELAVQDPQSDGVLVILTPQAMTDEAGTAEAIHSVAKRNRKPLLVSWMGGAGLDSGRGILNAAGIPTFEYPDTAARAFAMMWLYSDNLRALYETPTLAPEAAPTGAEGAISNFTGMLEPTQAGRDKQQADALITAVRKAGRTILTEVESKQLLSAYGIPTVETLVAFTEDEAVERAGRLGFPVAVKLFSETITHKTDVGGVQLDLRNAADVRRAWLEIERAVREKTETAGRSRTVDRVGPLDSTSRVSPADGFNTDETRRDNPPPLGTPVVPDFLGVTVQPMVTRDGYELILGSSIDPQFGPVLLFGAGGQLVEVFHDRALGLPPLNETLARRMMEQTRIYTALKGVRGRKSADLAALAQLLVRFSQLVAEQNWIAEIDINPLLVSSGGMIALDARVVLHPPKMREENLPLPAIRPYPTRLVAPWKLKDGASVTIRPIRPEDEPLMVRFHRTLSDRSVYNRYFMPLKLSERIAHERLSRICFIDYDREIVLVVERPDTKTNELEILGVGRLSKLHGANEAEFALTVSDQWQGHGLGAQLLRLLVQAGRDEKLERITATILAGNREMQHVARKAGFRVDFIPGENEFLAELVL